MNVVRRRSGRGLLRVSELPIVPYTVARVREGETVHLPDGGGVTVLEVYGDEEQGQEGGV